MDRGRFFFITGGARSGKSSYAEELAKLLGEPIAYLATAEAGDEEMALRISEHRKRRPSTWTTIEEPRNVSKVIEELGPKYKVILVDCLTLLITNLLFPSVSQQVTEVDQEQILQELKNLSEIAKRSPAHVIIVSNEVGLGLVPSYPQGRLFRDIAGWANQMMASEADKVYFLVSGIPLDLKKISANISEEKGLF